MSLGKVIEIFEHSDPDDEQMVSIFEDDVKDALHYLKVLAELLTLTNEPEEELNEPLTWDELKQMEGKPVWLEYGIEFQARHWIILPEMRCSYRYDRQTKDVFESGVVRFYKDDIGKMWKAYRKENK